MAFHDVQTGIDIHTIVRWTWADLAARDAESVSVADVGKVGLQTDLKRVWFLASESPITWKEMTGSVVAAHATQHQHGGGDEVATATPAANVIPKADGTGKLPLGFIPVIDDTVHGNRGGGSLHPAATDSVAGFLSASDKTKLNGVASGATNTPLASTAPVDVTKATAAIGVGTTAARQDHKHDIATAAPSNIGTANDEGTSTSLARADHVHAHGAQTDGTLHAVATDSVAGFMSPADKVKLDTLNTSARTIQHFAPTPTTSAPTTTSATFAAAIPQASVTMTPTSASNRIRVEFDCSFTHSNNNSNIDVAIFVDGVAQPNCQRGMQVGATSPRRVNFGIICEFTLSNVSHTIEIRWRTSAGTVTAELLYRSFVVEEIAA